MAGHGGTMNKSSPLRAIHLQIYLKPNKKIRKKVKAVNQK